MPTTADPLPAEPAGSSTPPCSRRPTAAVFNPRAPRTGRGVYALADIRDRCRVDEITGCWHWALASRVGGRQSGSLTPSVCVPAGVIGDKRRVLSVGRLVWLMGGKPLTAGQVVWRTCGHEDCCAPTHLMAGTKAEEGAWWRASGRRRGNPLRAAVNARNVASQAVPAETVQIVVEQLQAGVYQRDISAATGVHKATISKIANGRHYHQRPRGVRGASVFNLGAAGGA